METGCSGDGEELGGALATLWERPLHCSGCGLTLCVAKACNAFTSGGLRHRGDGATRAGLGSGRPEWNSVLPHSSRGLLGNEGSR